MFCSLARQPRLACCRTWSCRRTEATLRPLSNRIKEKATTAADLNCSNVLYQDTFESFDDMLAKEKEDAKNFIILEDKLSISAVLHRMDKVSVSQFLDAEVDKMYKYSVNRRKFALIKLQDYAQFKKKSVKSEDFLFPMTTRLLMTPGIEKKYLSTEDCNDHVCDVNAKRNLTATREALRKYSREQSDLAINQLISDCSVTEFGSKLRFVWLNQLEELLCAGLFSEFELRPFGSSVNAFGSDHSDLDIVFEPRTVQTEYEANKPRLAFQPKTLAVGLGASIKLVGAFGDQLSSFVPGVSSVIRISRARIPIVKFYSDFTGLDCDMSFLKAGSVETAAALFELNKINPQLRKLVSFLRIWSESHKLNSVQPGIGFSNFMLMALAISYFQVHSQHTTLPPIKSLNCQIKPSLKTPTKRRRQEQSAKFDEILKDFFYYIATFDYQNYGISILDGKIIVKPDHRQMYIENPFEHGHNITSGITKSELPGLITAAENAYVTLENVPEASLVDLLTPVNGSSGQNANRSSRIRSFKVGKRYNVGIKVDNFLREE